LLVKKIPTLCRVGILGTRDITAQDSSVLYVRTGAWKENQLTTPFTADLPRIYQAFPLISNYFHVLPLISTFHHVFPRFTAYFSCIFTVSLTPSDHVSHIFTADPTYLPRFSAFFHLFTLATKYCLPRIYPHTTVPRAVGISWFFPLSST
jgi:hypothetical protein